MNNETTTPESTPTEGGVKKPNVLMALIAYIIFFIPLLTDDKNDPFVKFHVKQGLVLFLVSVGGNMVLGMIPILGGLAMLPFNLALFVLWVLGIMNALAGKEKSLPLVGKLGESFNF